MGKNWSFLSACFGLIFCLYNLIQKTAPMTQLFDTKNNCTRRIQLQYTDRFMQEISKLVDDSIQK
jgi:HAE1 family hydrophobic/amphiphilic exporter-1/multidrug efflux pump